MSLHISTPLIESTTLSQKADRAIWLKMEALQPPGSFKIRGIGNACQRHAANGAQRFVSSSGGNAGLAVAYAGRKLGLPVTVVVPETTTEHALSLLAGEQAEVIVHGESWQEANAKAQSLLDSTTAFIHPFDDPLLWAGHASMIDEVASSALRPDAIVLSVGGGGLLSGVIEGLSRNHWQNVPVIAVETEGAASLNAAMSAGHLVELERISSIASSLGAKQVCERAFECSQRHDLHSVVVSDQEALAACEAFLADQRVLVEPACGASLALAYEAHPILNDFDTVLIIVCGGATATLAQIQQWRQQI